MANNFLALSGSIIIDGAIQTTGGDFEGNLIGTASWSNSAVSSSHALLADGLNASSLTLANLTITDTASIEYLNVVYQSSSVIYASGSNIFGDAPTDVQTLHGQVNMVDNATVTGKLNVDGGITGSLLGNVTGDLVGNAQTATSASHALEANHAINADLAQSSISSSYSANSDFAQLAASAAYADLAELSVSGSHAVESDHALNADTAVSASHALSSDLALNANSAISASHALLADGLNATSLTLADLTITNTASIQYLDVVYQSSSIIYSSGSNIFGDSPSDIQTLHGEVDIIDNATVQGALSVYGNTTFGDDIYADVMSVNSVVDFYGPTYVNNNLEVYGQATINNLTGSLHGNASTADFASQSDNAYNADSASNALNADVAISASHALLANLALNANNALTASYFLTSSVTSASFAVSSSWTPPIGFSKEWHVSDGSGSDATGDGSLSRPFKTLGRAFAVAGNTGEQIVVHPGLYLESTASLTKQNITIAAANMNAGGICYFNGAITIAPAASSTRISGLLFNNLIHSGSSGLYLDKVQVKANYTKIGSGYSEIINSDFQATGSIQFRGGTAVFQGDKIFAPVVSGSGTALYIKDSISCVAPSAVAGSTLVVADSQVYPAVSGSAAVVGAVGTVVYLYNSQITTTTGLPERISISGFLGYDDVQFNKNLSTVGTALNSRANFQSLDANNLTATGSLLGNASTATSASIANSINPSANITVAGLNIGSLGNYADDVAAAAAGVPVNGVYRNGNFLVIRVS